MAASLSSFSTYTPIHAHIHIAREISIRQQVILVAIAGDRGSTDCRPFVARRPTSLPGTVRENRSERGSRGGKRESADESKSEEMSALPDDAALWCRLSRP